MGKIISFSNQKGGVGKTTTVINVAAYIGAKGYKVIIVDLDPQGNASSGLNIENHQIDKTSYQVLVGNYSARDTIIKTAYEKLSIIPSNVDLSAAELDLFDMQEEREFQLKFALDKIKDDYDFVFIDCPPSLGILTINALCASDSVAIVLQCEYYALEGLSQLVNIIKKIQNSFNKNLSLEGVILTMFDSKTNLSRQVRDDVLDFFKSKVFKSIIPRNVKLSEAPSYGKPINIYDPTSKGAEAYNNLAEEFINNL